MALSLQAELIATLGAIGQEMPDTALALLVVDLKSYPHEAVSLALARCRAECRRITPSDIIARMPGGHPGVEEGWSMVAAGMDDARVTLVMTAPIREAFSKACDAYRYGGGIVAARMAFKEVYANAVAGANARKELPNWMVRLGSDTLMREGALRKAAAAGLITDEQVSRYLPAPIAQSRLGAAIAGVLTANPDARKMARRHIKKLRKVLERNRKRPAAGDVNNGGSA